LADWRPSVFQIIPTLIGSGLDLGKVIATFLVLSTAILVLPAIVVLYTIISITVWFCFYNRPYYNYYMHVILVKNRSSERLVVAGEIIPLNNNNLPH
jgi:hypothetical protein